MIETIPTLAALGMYLFPVDHPDLPECIGRHAPDRPCNGERGKHPVPLSWAKESTTCVAALHRAFGRGLRNIGIDCGRSGLVVLDEDATGELDRLCADHGQVLPVTFTVATGKGRHLYLEQPLDLPYTNAEGGLRNYQINVRGRGGYVVGPGARHATGRIYTQTTAAPIAPIPGWIAELLNPPVPTRARVEGPPAVDGGHRAVAGLLRVVLSAPQGMRNNTLNWASYHMWRKVAAGQVTASAAENMLIDAATTVGLAAGESRATIGSARRAVLGG